MPTPGGRRAEIGVGSSDQLKRIRTSAGGVVSLFDPDARRDS